VPVHDSCDEERLNIGLAFSSSWTAKTLNEGEKISSNAQGAKSLEGEELVEEVKEEFQILVWRAQPFARCKRPKTNEDTRLISEKRVERRLARLVEEVCVEVEDNIRMDQLFVKVVSHAL
jgi:hypothetical protein